MSTAGHGHGGNQSCSPGDGAALNVAHGLRQATGSLVGISAAAAAYSLAQLLSIAYKALKKVPVVSSRRYAWMLLAGDQVFAYAMLSAGSAAAAVANLNRTGIRHTALPNFCKPLPRFCDLSAASIACAFLSCAFLAASAVIDVIWLSNL
uniref:CASP-like protein n=1 Tax=Aegilops tauschii TaxID=37682 RepID=N1QSC2_AEGTA